MEVQSTLFIIHKSQFRITSGLGIVCFHQAKEQRFHFKIIFARRYIHIKTSFLINNS